jgi:hypothetical protein
MAQAVSPRPLTEEARVRSRVSPCGICCGRSGTGTGFSPSTSVFLCQFHSPVHLYKEKRKQTIFIIGLHNKPQGCGASVASAAGPFTTTKNSTVYIFHDDIKTKVKLSYLPLSSKSGAVSATSFIRYLSFSSQNQAYLLRRDAV